MSRNNTLTFPQLRSLAQWLEQNAVAKNLDGQTYEHVAEAAAKALEFPVTVGNIKGMKSSLNLSWRNARQRAKPTTVSADDLLCVVQFLIDTVSIERRKEIDPDDCLGNLYTRLIDETQ